MEGKLPRRRHAQPSFHTIYFRDGILSLPGYAFEKAVRWEDTGSHTQLAEGSSLKDGSPVLAKIAPAHTNASVCLEREAHILGEIQTHTEAFNMSIRMIDFFTLPRANGDCVVLLLSHPGPNLLGRYLPRSRVNDLLLAEHVHVKKPLPSEDIYMDIDELEVEQADTMDLATFLEFAIQATYCLEQIHRLSIIHREVRANAFHINTHSGVVRLVHFGNRSESLERYGGPTSLVLRSDTYEEADKEKVKEVLCYLAPEQTGSVETNTEDHRTDLYSLGILFWTLLVGRGMMPFQGQALEILHSVAQKRAMPVHEVRRDIPQVLAEIIEKLLNKNADQRYQSAYGLKADLLECQLRLLNAVSSSKDDSVELIPSFEIASKDRYVVFTIPNALFGREKEIEMIRKVIRHSYSHYTVGDKGIAISSSSGSHKTTASAAGDNPETSNRSNPSSRSASPARAGGGDNNSVTMGTVSDVSPSVGPTLGSGTGTVGPGQETLGVSSVGSPVASMTDGLRRIALQPSQRRSIRAHAICIVGPAGAGKSSLVLSQQPKWRQTGLFAHAKFQASVSSPFAALFSCLSSALRQLMAFQSDLHRFVDALRTRLGPQIRILPLLYAGAPELEDIMNLFQITIDTPQEALSTPELRARFNSLAENVIGALADTKMFALFLDDLHEADESSMDLINTLAHTKSRILIFATLREDKPETLERVRGIFTGRSKATWIQLSPLPYSAIAGLVSRTLHRRKEDAAPLSRLIHAASGGNAFSARSILTRLQRQNMIKFNYDHNEWQYDMTDIEGTLVMNEVADPNDLTFLISHLKQLPEDGRRYIIWASFFGATFKVTDVALVMEKDDVSSGSEAEDDDDWSVTEVASHLKDREREKGKETSNRGSMKGMQVAIAEGWIVNRGRDECSFAHDRYRQAAEAEAATIPEGNLAKMSFRIISVMLHEPNPDMFKIAERAQRCLPLLREHGRREELVALLIDAGQSAWAKGAHEIAYQAFINARALLEGELWESNKARAFNMLSKLAELATWRSSYDESDAFINECYDHAEDIELKANLLRLRSRNQFMRNKFSDALSYTLQALRLLGVEMMANPTMEMADAMFEEVKNELLAVGFDAVLRIPRATDPKMDLAVSLLSEAALHAYWNTSGAFTNVIGLKTVQLALRHGISPGTGLGLFFVLEAAERRQLCRFAVDLGQIALKLSDMYGTSVEKGRSLVLYSTMVVGYENSHIRTNIPRLEQAVKHAASAGDRTFAAFSSLHTIVTKISLSVHMDELLVAAEDSLNDINLWVPKSDTVILSKGLLCCIRALGGYTLATSADNIYQTDTFDETQYLSDALPLTDNQTMVMNWFNSYKVVALFSLGFTTEAAELGFSVYETRHSHPNHRHTRFAMFFHSLAMIACIRRGECPHTTRYFSQIALNQAFLRTWSVSSPINTSHWVTLVDAELSSLENGMEALRLYDEAVKLCTNNDWLLEEGWALWLEGAHLLRCGVDGLGGDLMRRGISRQNHWGARGIANYLTSMVDYRHKSLKRNLFSSSVGVQTDAALVTVAAESGTQYDGSNLSHGPEEDDGVLLPASDLSNVLKWSKDIASDIHLSSALQRLTEIATEQSGAQVASLVVSGEAGEYNMATSILTPEPCRTYEKPVSIRNIPDPLQRAVIEYALNGKERVFLEEVSSDSRFASEAEESPYTSVICLPLFSNRGQTLGALYMAAKSPFAQKTYTVMTLLVQQASISVANALLFRSVQSGTRENLKMIQTQREALEAARRSREEALQATKIKSSFLASMSHELRTPFSQVFLLSLSVPSTRTGEVSSFYGLLDILWGTELNVGQRELVQTAKQSCELLLKIIDSILDYSKLEASALKLENSGFAVEGLIADCMELLLPQAAHNGLDLAFDIAPDVPAWVEADYARIRQVLMNLIGNAVKFTQDGGSVKVTCILEKTITGSDGVHSSMELKFVIQDTGIGLSPSDVELLFVPFQQADNSSTRRYGGTGLGLSICRSLVMLMGGDIGVKSELGKGSTFYFHVPVALFESRESRKAMSDLALLRARLLKPQPPRIVINSPSDTTLSLLRTMLEGFDVTAVSTTGELMNAIHTFGRSLSYIIIDHQSETHADDMARQTLPNTKVIHLYTPVAEGVTGHAMMRDNVPGVMRLTKPPRTVRILHALASLSNMPPELYANITNEPSPASEELPPPQRMLFGNVLVAEDNPIARQLLRKQLENYDLKVVAASNGQEAVSMWESHEPGFFSVALFDHHMPVCDGVEAAKRVRELESRRELTVRLPIVALSADCQESTKRLCLSAGMDAFLSKPLRKADQLLLLSLFNASIVHTPGPQ